MTIIATTNATLYVTDQNNNPLPGASVFISGLSSGQTASDGSLVVSLPSNVSSVGVQASLSGYQTYTGSIETNTTSTAISLISNTPTAVPISLVIETPGATYSTTGSGGFTDSGTIGTGNTVTTAVGYLPGTYSLAWSYQGVNRTDSLVVTAGTTVYNFSPLPVPDSGTTSGGAATTATTPGSVASPNTSANPQYPFTYPPYNYGKYFTPTQAFIYIGDLFIDELVGFHYVLQDNKVPVFGYSSRRMDAVGTGKSLIQGQFNINFISEGYLYTVLNEFKNNNTPIQVDGTPTSQTSAINLYQQYIALAASPNLASVQTQLNNIKQQLNQLLSKDASLPSVLASAQAQSTQVLTSNAVYTDIPFDIVLQFEGGGRTVEQRIDNCVLTSNEMILGDNDSVIADSYGFIARSIGYSHGKGTLKVLSS